jgi:hypothetical protein
MKLNYDETMTFQSLQIYNVIKTKLSGLSPPANYID